MTVSMRVMSAGDGYRYLLKSVATGDGNRDLSTPLTRYYAQKGTPPGTWIGSGAANLGAGQLTSGDVVSEEQLRLLLGMGRDPITGDPLGRAFPVYRPREERIRARIEALGPELSVDDRAAAVTAIESEEAGRGGRRAVAGFDYTFSVPKSVSALWAVADAGTQSLIATAHHLAVADVIDLMEREVAATRTGFAATDGAVAQVDVTGLIGTAFDHYDSRAGDPQLHTHVVISNKVRTVYDGKWRSLDGRPMHAAVVALSEHYNGLLADHLTRDLGLWWEKRGRGRDRNPAWELAAVPEELIAEFSSRSRDIDAEKDRLIADYIAAHGREPSATTVIKLRAQATLTTRPEKEARSLAELTADWRSRATGVLGQDAPTWATRLIATGDRPRTLRADDLPLDVLAEVGRTVVDVVGDRRSTWRHWNLHAEASRQVMGLRFASVQDREAVVGLIVDAAEQASLRLTPPELASSPVVFRRPDGTSVFRPKHSVIFSSTELLAAEDRLLELTRTTTAHAVDIETVERVARRTDAQGRVLGEDQARALVAVAVSGRVVDVLVGPAGAGKTMAMNALRRAWEREHGPGSVVGLAPSAAAAQVLADDLGVVTENTAKWLYDHTRGYAGLQPGQLVILDEASLAGTHTLDRIAEHAAAVGAKLLLVGDPAQLDAVDAGGAFGMLVRDRDDVPELGDIHRFLHDWEKRTSLRVRIGDTAVIDTYHDRGRIRDGETDVLLDAAYAAWLADLAAGKQSMIISETQDTVTALNVRARLDRIIAGQVAATGQVRLHDGTEASQGDLVITRHNDRRLLAGKGWVKNGDRWIVTATDRDGSVTVRRPGHRLGGRVVLPAWYVAEHLELAYAVTTHRAQGSTVDTAHAIVHSPAMTRESFYVAMTRGRESNIAYVATDQAEREEYQHVPGDEVTARSVLFGVLQHVGAEPSAHEAIEAEFGRWSGIAQLAAEYETIAAAAQHDRWVELIERSGLPSDQVEAVLASDAFGPLAAELRRAEANHHDIDTLLPRLVAARGFADAEDVAAVLHYRVATATARRSGASRGRAAARLITGLIPEATGPMTDEMRHALHERQQLIEARADALTETAIAQHEPWTRVLGAPPRGPQRYQAWAREAGIVAAYRDRYQVTTSSPLGPAPESTTQRVDAARARAALRHAHQIATADSGSDLGSETRSMPTRHAGTSL